VLTGKTWPPPSSGPRQAQKQCVKSPSLPNLPFHGPTSSPRKVTVVRARPCPPTGLTSVPNLPTCWINFFFVIRGVGLGPKIRIQSTLENRKGRGPCPDEDCRPKKTRQRKINRKSLVLLPPFHNAVWKMTILPAGYLPGQGRKPEGPTSAANPRGLQGFFPLNNNNHPPRPDLDCVVQRAKLR